MEGLPEEPLADLIVTVVLSVLLGLMILVTVIGKGQNDRVIRTFYYACVLNILGLALHTFHTEYLKYSAYRKIIIGHAFTIRMDLMCPRFSALPDRNG